MRGGVLEAVAKTEGELRLTIFDASFDVVETSYKSGLHDCKRDRNHYCRRSSLFRVY